jgi:hypothetical protein
MLDYTSKRITTERLTLRIPSHLFASIKKESDKKDLPVNALINRVLEKAFLYEGQLNVLPRISISHILFGKIIEELDDSSIEKTAKIGSDIVKKYFTLQNQTLTLDNVITNYFSLLSKYCGWFTFHSERISNKYRLVFEASIGSKWSQFLFNYLKSILSMIGASIVNESRDDNVIVFEVLKKEKYLQ